MRLLTIVVAVLLGAGSLAAEDLSAWESRGDAFAQAQRWERAVLAYETALAAEPSNKRVLRKYQTAFLHVFASGKIEDDREPVAPLGPKGTSRLGYRPAPRPSSPGARPSPEDFPEEPASLDGEGEGDPGPDAEVRDGDQGADLADDSESADPPDASRDREPAAETRNRESRRPRVRGISRMGGARRTPARDRNESPEEGDGDEEPRGPRRYGGAQTVQLDAARTGYEGSQGEEIPEENTVIQTTKYEITNVKVVYKGSNLHIQGKIKNISGGLIKLPRVYCRIYDDQNVLRGRNYSYLKPGRNLFAKKATKKFDVIFRGYTDQVSSYQFEVVP